MPLSVRASSPAFTGRFRRLAACAVVASFASNASASDEKQVCVRAVERAQVDRLDGKLRAAREGFVTCARAVCPDAIRQDCTRWVAEVDASLPTVVIDAAWADGRDVAGLVVTLDGHPLADAASGRAVTLDPGAHAFRFELPGAEPVETRNVIREGEKNRILRVVFRPVTSTASAPATTAAPPSDTSPAPVVAVPWRSPSAAERGTRATRRLIPTSAFVVGGFALAGFGGFAYAGLSGLGQLDRLRATCAPSCAPSVVHSARNAILVGDILGIEALVAAGVTAWIVLTRPAAASQVATP